jgi:hypothetical protein
MQMDCDLSVSGLRVDVRRDDCNTQQRVGSCPFQCCSPAVTPFFCPAPLLCRCVVIMRAMAPACRGSAPKTCSGGRGGGRLRGWEGETEGERLCDVLLIDAAPPFPSVELVK